MLRWLLFLPLVILLALFALSNTEEVEIRLWPFELAWLTPLGMAVLLLSAIAFMAGAAIAWAAALGARRRLAKMERAAKLLEAELASYKARESAARHEADLGRPVPATALAAPERR